MFVFRRYLNKPDMYLSVETSCLLTDKIRNKIAFLRIDKSKKQKMNSSIAMCIIVL